MSINPYEKCPCGSGKKVKWCCADLAKEIAKIKEDMEHGRYSQALRIINACLKRKPKHRWLETMRVMALYKANRFDEAEAQLETLLQHNPDGHLWAIYVQAKCLREPEAYPELIQDGMESLQELKERLQFLARLLSNQSNLPALGPFAELSYARAILHCLEKQEFSKDGEESQVDEALVKETREAISRMENNFVVPIWLRLKWELKELPSDSDADDELRAKWTEACLLAKRGLFRRAAAILNEVAEQRPQLAEARFNEGLCLAAMGLESKAAEALRKYCELAEDENEILEVESFACALTGDYLPGPCERTALYYAVKHPPSLVKQLEESELTGRIDSEKQVKLWGLYSGPQSNDLDDQADALAAYQPAIALVQQVVPREVRVQCLIEDTDAVRRMFLDIVGDAVDVSSEKRETLEMSPVICLLEPPCRDVGRIGLSRPPVLFAGHKHNYEKYWPDMPIPCLAGRTPRESVNEPVLRRKIRAALRVVEYQFHSMGFAPPDLRSALGLEPEPKVQLNGVKLADLQPSMLPYVELDGLETAQLVEFRNKAKQAGYRAQAIEADRRLLERAEANDPGVPLRLVGKDLLWHAITLNDEKLFEELATRIKKASDDDPVIHMEVEITKLNLYYVLADQEKFERQIARAAGMALQLSDECLEMFLNAMMMYRLLRLVESPDQPGKPVFDMSIINAMCARHAQEHHMGQLEAQRLRPKVWTPTDAQPAPDASAAGEPPRIWTPDD